MLLLTTYEQLTQVLEMFGVVKRVFTVAIWTQVSKFRALSSADNRFRLMSTFTTPSKKPPKVSVRRVM